MPVFLQYNESAGMVMIGSHSSLSVCVNIYEIKELYAYAHDM